MLGRCLRFKVGRGRRPGLQYDAKNDMRWSIRYQLLVPLAALLVGTVGVSAWTAAAAARRTREQIAARVGGVVHTLSEAHFPLTRTVLEQMKGLSGAEYILEDGGGQLTTTLPQHPVELPTIRSAPGDPEIGERIELRGATYLGQTIRLKPPHPSAGARLYVLYPEAKLQDELRAAAWPLLALGVGSGLCAVALAIGVGRRLVGRINELDRQTRRIANGDFQPMPLTGRNDELLDLRLSVNDMAEKLRQMHESIQHGERLRLLGQLSGGLAHQLRNAVAGAKLAVQLHERACQSAESESLDVARRQLGRIESDLSRFLDLGRNGEPVRKPCHIAQLVDDSVGLLRPQCRHQDIQLKWACPQVDPVVVADSARLRHIIANLLTNAIEAAGPGGHVEVLVGLEGQLVVLEVSDSGPGPRADVADAVFEPFVTGKQEGVGLGLFVARQAAEAHDGRLTWRRENGQTCFRLELPSADPSLYDEEDSTCRKVDAIGPK